MLVVVAVEAVDDVDTGVVYSWKAMGSIANWSVRRLWLSLRGGKRGAVDRALAEFRSAHAMRRRR